MFIFSAPYICWNEIEGDLKCNHVDLETMKRIKDSINEHAKVYDFDYLTTRDYVGNKCEYTEYENSYVDYIHQFIKCHTINDYVSRIYRSVQSTVLYFQTDVSVPDLTYENPLHVDNNLADKGNSLSKEKLIVICDNTDNYAHKVFPPSDEKLAVSSVCTAERNVAENVFSASNEEVYVNSNNSNTSVDGDVQLFGDKKMITSDSTFTLKNLSVSVQEAESEKYEATNNKQGTQQGNNNVAKDDNNVQKDPFQKIASNIIQKIMTSIEMLANKMLNKIESLEKKLTDQSFKLEKKGHKDSKELYYNFQGKKEKMNNKLDNTCSPNSKNTIDLEEAVMKSKRKYSREMDKDHHQYNSLKARNLNGKTKIIDYSDSIKSKNKEDMKHDLKVNNNVRKLGKKTKKLEGEKIAFIIALLKKRCSKKRVISKSSMIHLYYKLKEVSKKSVQMSDELFFELYIKKCWFNFEGFKENKDKLKRANRKMFVKKYKKTDSRQQSNPDRYILRVNTFNRLAKEWTASSVKLPYNKKNTNHNWFLNSGKSRSRIRW